METSTTATGVQVITWQKERPEAKPRVFDDLSILPEPTEPRCTDPDCESWYCSNGHPEVDHRVWNLWKTREIRARRERVIPVVAEFLGVDPASVRIRFSVKAGCSCGCSPGWVLESHWHGQNISLKFD